MAIEDSVLALGPGGAVGVFQETGALVQCPVHPEIFVRIRDAGKERHAYELADELLRGRPDAEPAVSRFQTLSKSSCKSVRCIAKT
jgi:hypothetical protein